MHQFADKNTTENSALDFLWLFNEFYDFGKN